MCGRLSYRHVDKDKQYIWYVFKIIQQPPSIQHGNEQKNGTKKLTGETTELCTFMIRKPTLALFLPKLSVGVRKKQTDASFQFVPRTSFFGL